VLLIIIFDGEFFDMQDTIAAIVETVHLPLLLLIVSVGDAGPLAPLNFLDGRVGRVSNMGCKKECLSLLSTPPFIHWLFLYKDHHYVCHWKTNF
jgi:hypothetical protein